jgi:RNA polymerase sigma-70 factor (ECF subfamily)
VLLADQDRTRWHHDEVAEARRLLARPELTAPLTPLAASYVLQAQIAAEHATAPSAEDTRWDRIVGLYDVLLQVVPTPSARLARAVAVAEQHGPAAGLDALEGLDVPESHRPAAVRAELLSRAGDLDAARAAYDQAIAACRNEVEKAFLVDRRDAL